ncbi:hypothetical protein N431DRAFT_461225 [Stipitochalara longipes BDJ]|nr:hypothetical protein N431DRAFT_461225 [Stipitochalara longipes BDJ]
MHLVGICKCIVSFSNSQQRDIIGHARQGNAKATATIEFSVAGCWSTAHEIPSLKGRSGCIVCAVLEIIRNISAQSSRPNQTHELLQPLVHLAWLPKLSEISTPYATIVIFVAAVARGLAFKPPSAHEAPHDGVSGGVVALQIMSSAETMRASRASNGLRQG